MSIRATKFVWGLDLPVNEKIVLLAIAEHIGKTGHCWPGQERLAVYSNMSVRTVRTLLKKLEEKGVLLRERGRGGDGSGRSTDRYRLNHNWTPGGYRQVLPVGATGNSEGGNRQTVAGTENHKGTVSTTTKRATTIPDNWTPNSEHRAMAASRVLDVEEQALMFRNHAESTDRHLVRWDQAFSNWLMYARPQRAFVPNNQPRREVAPAPRYPDAPPVPDDWEPPPFARPGAS